MGVTSLVARNEENGVDEALYSVAGALTGKPGAIDTRLMRFDAVADMPADITSAANVAADRIELDGFTPTARRVQIIWHGAGLSGPDTQATQAFYGEIAMGAMVTINADTDAIADTRLTFTDLTGGGTSSAGKSNFLMVSKSAPFAEIAMNEEILRIDCIGVPNGLTATNLDTLLPCFLEVRVLG